MDNPNNYKPVRGLTARTIISIGNGLLYLGTAIGHLCKGAAAAIGLVLETAIVGAVTVVAKALAILDEVVLAAIGTFTDSMYAADMYVRATFVTWFGIGVPKHRAGKPQQAETQQVQVLEPFPGNTVLAEVDQSYYTTRNKKVAQNINSVIEGVGKRILNAYSSYVRPGFLPEPIIDTLLATPEATQATEPNHNRPSII